MRYCSSREVEMAEYWPGSILWIKTRSRSIKTSPQQQQQKNNKQTKKEDETEDLLHVHENCFLAGPTRDIPRKRERTIPARVTSHNTFASSCPLAEAQPFHYDV